MPPSETRSREIRTNNPFGALSGANGVFKLKPTGEFEVICLPGHGPASLKELWAVEYQGPVTASDIQALIAEGIIGPETCQGLGLPPAQLGQKRGRGRPKGLDDETQERIRMAAAFELCGWSKMKMAPYILTDQSTSAESNIYRFHYDHGELIAAGKQQLTEEMARTMVSDRVKAPKPPSKNS